MKRQKLALAGYVSAILGNTAVIGMGLAFYEQKWWCLFSAVVAAVLGGIIVWRSGND